MDVLTVNTAAQIPDETSSTVRTFTARQQAGAGGREWLLRSADELDFVSGERMAESLEWWRRSPRPSMVPGSSLH